MAEEQDKQKPKTTLIKHTKHDSSDGQDKKKVRVVVKRKPKPKVVVRKPDESAEAGAAPSPAAEKPDERRSEAVEPTRREAPATPAAEKNETASGETAPGEAVTRAEATAPADAPVENKEKQPPAEPKKPAERGLSDRGSSDRNAERRPSEGSYRPPLREDGSGRTVPGPTRRPGPLPQRQVRGGRPGQSSDRGPGSPQGRPGGPGRGGATGRPSPGGRPGGPGRPGGTGRPGPGGRPGAPGRPAGARPSGPPRGETRRPEGAPGGETTGRTPGKKFYKSKRTGAKFERDERVQEKEFSFNRKKPQPKANPVPKEIDIMEVVTVSELARKMNLKANELIGKLMGMGMMVTINQQIDAETAEILAAEYDCKVNIVSLYEETLIETQEDKQEDLRPRPPIVTVMGHVDHGKTKLLDAIRSTNVVDDEHGGITQHIGAYQVSVDNQKVTFLDTPGHEAFTMMRARGAQVTDIVVLVVAANDGVMPQTVEAISHARDAKVPIIVAINKVDLPEANVDNVKQQLSKHDLIPQDWGGTIEMVEVSALKRQGIDTLLETILLHAEVLELTANYDRNAEGKVIESRIDPGRGTVATALIERGTLKVGDSFVAGIFPGKVRAMFDDHGQRVDEATPSMPVEVLGFDGVPEAGDPFQVTDDDKTARQVGSKRQELKRVEEARNVKKITLDNIFDSIQEGEIQELKVVIKGDVHGSVEALQNALERLSTGEIRLVVIHASAGAINEGDVMLASASNAIVVGFHVRPTPRAQAAAEREKVEIRKYNIIYDAVEDIRSAMEGMLAPDLKEEVIGLVEVRETFKVPKIGVIAGSYVTEGKITRDSKVRVYRDGVQIFEGEIGSLKRFKDDAKSVDAGYECGVGIEKFNDIQIGDQIEAYLVREVAKKL